MQKHITIKEVAKRWALAQPSVTAFISLFIPRFHDAQDVLQEVAAAVLSHDFENKGWPNSFENWILGIARHKALDYCRRSKRDKLVFDSETIDRLMDAHESLADQFSIRREALEHCIRRVPAKSRQILSLRYEKELAASEIAGKLGLGATAVAVSLHRTRAALRTCIEDRIARKGWK